MASEPGQFIGYELLTNDVDSALRFYNSVIGWTARDSGTPGMDYRILSAQDAMIGGLMTIPPEAAEKGMPPMWLGYLKVDDVDETVARVQHAGGGLHYPATDIPGVGRFAAVADPQGAAIYVMAPSTTEGVSKAFAPGSLGHVGWNELHTSDWQAAFAFYGAEFGWGEADALDMGPMGTYLLFHAGADAIGGMMNDPDAALPYWMFYFIVDTIDSAKARLEAAGGRVLHGPQQVPGGGWVLHALDPQGAMFALVAPVKA